MARLVRTESGLVEGAVEHGIDAFRGIPYGRTDGSRGRGLAPRRPKAWPGVLLCDQPGPACPQPGTVSGVEFELSSQIHFEAMVNFRAPPGERHSEECLVTNVWTPSLGRSALRPVMVWLHGGAWNIGSGSGASCNGSLLAKRGDVVVVAINHRLDIFGHLYLRDWFGEDYADSGNVGLLDIVLALRWVRDNIAAFGGDPDNITIFGASGGGSKVTMMLASPIAKGLFHRAIVQSGYSLLEAPDTEKAAAATAQVMGQLGIARGDVRRFGTIDTDQLVSLSANLDYEFRPVIDGLTLPDHPTTLFLQGAGSAVPTIIGCTTNDHQVLLEERFGWYTEAEARARLRGPIPWSQSTFGDASDTLYELYRAESPGASPSTLLTMLWTDFAWRVPSTLLGDLRAVAGGNTWMYEFLLGIPFHSHLVFDHHDAPIFGQSPVRGLASQVNPAWTRFAEFGKPDHSGLPQWGRYALPRRNTMMFDFDVRIEADPRGPQRRAMMGELLKVLPDSVADSLRTRELS